VGRRWIVGDERFPDSQPEPELREDWEAGKGFGFLLLAGSIGSFIVSYWHFRLDFLWSIEAALIAFPGVAVLLIPFIVSIKWAIHKGFSPSIVLILTIIATVPFLITLFIVLYMMAVPVWISVIAIGIICGILLIMYDSAKRTRLK
jgi:hypothetical protein